MCGLNTDNVDEDIVVDNLEVEQRETKDKEFVVPGGQVLGLDQAVLQSIERCRKWSTLLNSKSFYLIYYIFFSIPANDELRRKMYGCILVVGGGKTKCRPVVFLIYFYYSFKCARYEIHWDWKMAPKSCRITNSIFIPIWSTWHCY